MPPTSRRLGKTDAALLKAGICPICGAGPYTVPAIHVSKAHGIDRKLLRTSVGLPGYESICDPTHSRACSDRGKVEGASVLQDAYPKRRQRLIQRAHEWAAMNDAGQTVRQIAEEAGMAESGVRLWLRRIGHITNTEPMKEIVRTKRGPQPHLYKPTCAAGHPYTDAGTYWTPSGKRVCRICMRVHDRKRLSGSMRQRLAREARS